MSFLTSVQLNTLCCDIINEHLDGVPLVVGVITFLKQFHSQHTHTFLGYLGQYIRTNIGFPKSKVIDVPLKVQKVICFLSEFARFSNMSRQAIEAVVPSYLFDRYTT